MTSGPTRGAAERQNAWRASPRLALAVRIAAFLIPIVIAYFVIRLVSPWLYRPAGWFGLVPWILQATAIGAVVSNGVSRLTRRMLPLATLLTTTLIFPDRAPSRFGVALRSGTVKQMKRRATELQRDGLGTTPAEAAENAIVLVTGLGRHDRLTRGHTERVRAYADLIAQEMGLSDSDRNWLAWGVLLHDVGKMTVPPEVLNKVERLTDEEWAVLKNHPAAGAEMLQPLAPWLGDWVRAAGEHHERWDGGGYPAGLEAEEISLAGRIAAVADAYDVITSKRSYKEPMSAEAARQELVDCAGTQFDPVVVRAFLAVSLGHGPAAGSLAWLTELPIVRGAIVAGTSPAATALGAAALTTSALLGLGDDAASRRAAFASEFGPFSGDSIPTVEIDVDPAATTDPTSSVADPTNPPTVPSTSPPDETDDTEPVATSTTSEPPTPPVTSTTIATAETGTTTVPPDAPSPTSSAPTTVPATTTPGTTVPTVTDPTVVTTVPSVTVPSVTVPSVTVPSVTVPSVTVPSVTVPSVTTPLVTTPVITTPPVTTPAITTPAITTPVITTPPIEIPELPLGDLLG